MGEILTGNPVSKGKAKAETYFYKTFMPDMGTGYFKAGKETEYWGAFSAAKEKSEQELQELYRQLSEEDEKTAAIFAAHLTILRDEDLLYDIKSAILNDRMYPNLAIEACMGEVISSMKDIRDIMAERYIADIRDVKQRLLRNYFGKAAQSLAYLKRDVILVVEYLLPSDLGEIGMIDWSHVKGIITEKDDTDSHVIVLAKSYGVPMITGVTEATRIIHSGEMIEIDGETGKITFENPLDLTYNFSK